MKYLICLMFLLLASCAKSSGNEPDSRPYVYAVPDASCTYHMTGARTFCNGINTSVVAYDCGVRNGRHCWFFEHTPDAMDANHYEDAVCVLPNTSGDECASIVNN